MSLLLGSELLQSVATLQTNKPRHSCLDKVAVSCCNGCLVHSLSEGSDAFLAVAFVLVLFRRWLWRRGLCCLAGVCGCLGIERRSGCGSAELSRNLPDASSLEIQHGLDVSQQQPQSASDQDTDGAQALLQA